MSDLYPNPIRDEDKQAWLAAAWHDRKADELMREARYHETLATGIRRAIQFDEERPTLVPASRAEAER